MATTPRVSNPPLSLATGPESKGPTQDEIVAFDKLWTDALHAGPIGARMKRYKLCPRDIRVWTAHSPLRMDDDARAVIRSEIAAAMQGRAVLLELHHACTRGVVLPARLSEAQVAEQADAWCLDATLAADACVAAWHKLGPDAHPKTRLALATYWIAPLACIRFDPSQLSRREAYLLRRSIFSNAAYELVSYLLPFVAPALPQSAFLPSINYRF